MVNDWREESFSDFFGTATSGFMPYGWQLQIAVDGLPDVLRSDGAWEDGSRAGVGLATSCRQVARAVAPCGLSADAQPRDADRAASHWKSLWEPSMNTNSLRRRSDAAER